MTVLAQKTTKTAAITLELLLGAAIMLAAFVALPIGIFPLDESLITNAFVWCVVLAGMLFFGSVGFFCYVRPYILFRRLPQVQAETDGTYLYIHTTKEAKIPLSEMKNAYLHADVSYFLNWDLLVHFLSDRHGNVLIQVPGYGKYKLRFISQAKEVPHRILALTENMV